MPYIYVGVLFVGPSGIWRCLIDLLFNGSAEDDLCCRHLYCALNWKG